MDYTKTQVYEGIPLVDVIRPGRVYGTPYKDELYANGYIVLTDVITWYQFSRDQLHERMWMSETLRHSNTERTRVM